MTTPFCKVLVANRGEIAVRIIRTARMLGYRTVAVFSEIDRELPHVALADQAVPIGPQNSYLSIERILAAARRAGADAVHPGYGFLSENAAFASACEDAGLVFIGPPAAAIRAMGNKAAAKRLMVEAGIPCVPGYEGAAQDDRALAREAGCIGFPVMVKAAAGGGGKGMRLVATAAELGDALRAARAEAAKAFGSDALILEKAIAEPRHVEIQIFADRHGNAIHLGERDCSIQRRHQKIIEEAPSPALSRRLRAEMGEAAVNVARAVSYVGAGTVEFLLAPDGGYFFLEMNTRLQVEHPVTEAVTGLDLVAWQLRVAAGEPLPLRQDEVRLSGHAIEARLCAEDPAEDFLPQAGTLLAWEPPEVAGLRVDHGLAPGATISPFYDPLLAKIIAHGATREEARRRLVAGLENFTVLGIATNRRFLVACLDHPSFAAGEVSTGFIARHFPPERRRPAAPDARMTALAAALLYHHAAAATGVDALRNATLGGAPLFLAAGNQRLAVSIVAESGGRYAVAATGWRHEVELVAAAPNRIRFRADGLEETARIAWDRDTLHLALGEVEAVFEDVLFAPAVAADSAAANAALAPMTGTVVELRVAPGDAVHRGQCLVVLEAMKMQHEIKAPRDGTVAAVLAAIGDQVATRKILVELAP